MNTPEPLTIHAISDATAPADPTPVITGLLAEEPDLVDRIFAFLAQIQPEMFGPGADLARAKRAVRDEFGGTGKRDGVYIRSARQERARETAAEVLRHFNGRNASEVARELGISRATVYRCIKQPGR